MKAKCFECGSVSHHEHHIVPKSVGGTKTIPLCNVCHGKAHHSQIAAPSLTRLALQKRKNAGLKYSTVPFGFDDVGGVLIANEKESQVVDSVIKQRKAGQTLWQIANDLNSRGITGKRGGRWHASSVRYLVARVSA